MLPITGPFDSRQSNHIDGAGSLSIEKRVFRQKRPYDIPTTGWRSYYTYTLNAWSYKGASFGGMANASTAKGPWWAYAYRCDVTTSELVDAHARCYDKFVGKIHQNAGALINFTQRQQAAQMLTLRLTQLLSAVKSVKRGYIPASWRYQALNRRLRKRESPLPGIFGGKMASDLWLEYHFGWEPMFNDISAAIEILQSPFKNKRVFASSKKPISWTISGSPTPSYWTGEHKGDVVCRMSADVQVTNPNLLLASSLGFTNPAAAAWDLVPFSFVVDWFLPVSRFLNQWSDFHGLKLLYPCTTYRGRVWTTGRYYNGFFPDPGFGLYRSIDSLCVSTWRDAGISAFNVFKPPPFHLSLSKAATSAALVLQQLSKLAKVRL